MKKTKKWKPKDFKKTEKEHITDIRGFQEFINRNAHKFVDILNRVLDKKKK